MSAKKILIGGIGRAGTSLLARMFIELGLRGGDLAGHDGMDTYANAGYEETVKSALELLHDAHCEVIKTPWIYQLCEEESFNTSNISFVITPIRMPFVSTVSRSMNEIGHLLDAGHIDRALGMVNGQYPGSIYYSASVDQQEQLSNQCFSYLCYWCAVKKIPIITTPFPSSFDDVDYLVALLEPVHNFYNIDARDLRAWVLKNYSSSQITASLSDAIDPEIHRHLLQLFSSKKPSDGLLFIKALEKLLASYNHEINHLKNITKPTLSSLSKLAQIVRGILHKRSYLY
jgi:hypothetical protein